MAVRHDNSPTALVAAKAREASKRGRHKQSGRGSGLTPSVMTAIELLIFGKKDDPGAILKLEDAATAAGISGRALRAAMLKPAVEHFYQKQLAALRNGERAASIRTIAQIRDDTALKATAAGQNVRLKAADTLAFDRPETQVNVQVNNTVNVTPGYVLDLTPDPDEPRRMTIDAEPVDEIVVSTI